MSHFGQIHHEDDFWLEEGELEKREKDAPWGLLFLVIAMVLGLIVWSCIGAHQDSKEQPKTVPVGSPG